LYFYIADTRADGFDPRFLHAIERIGLRELGEKRGVRVFVSEEAHAIGQIIYGHGTTCARTDDSQAWWLLGQ
jgi:hypothetical protein